MKIGILGSGMVGQNLGSVLARGGHEVVLGTRSPEALDEARGQMARPLREWLAQAGGGARVGEMREAAAHGEVVLNAAHGAASLDALALAGEENLRGKTLIDVSNPLDFSRGLPPTLLVCDDDSLGERIQTRFPEAKVVRTLNTTNPFLMGDPGQIAGGEHSMFVCGNRPDARRRVGGYLCDWFGWRDVIDLGDLTGARGMEMLLPIWIRLWGALGTPAFNFRVVR